MGDLCGFEIEDFGYHYYYCENYNQYCCDDDLHLCCTYIYGLWWFWSIWVVAILLCAGCGMLCRRRYYARREMVLVRTEVAPVYGTIPPPQYGQVPNTAPYAAAAPQKPPAYQGP